LLWQWGSQRLITHKKIVRIGQREEESLRKYSENLNRTRKLQFTHIYIYKFVFILVCHRLDSVADAKVVKELSKLSKAQIELAAASENLCVI
jgi:hypothetical protein